MLSFNHPCIKLPNQISLFYHTNILQIPDGKLNTHTNIHTHNIRTENHNSHTHIWNKKNTNSKKLKPNPKQTKKHETPNPPSCCLATLSCNNNNDFQKTSSNTLSRPAAAGAVPSQNPETNSNAQDLGQGHVKLRWGYMFFCFYLFMKQNT